MVRGLCGLSPLLVSHSLRHLTKHQWQTWLTIIGIMLGVTIVVAVDLANASARKAFTLSLETLTGNATHQLSAGPSGIDEHLFGKIKSELGFKQLTPSVSDYVKVKGRVFTLLGIDPLSNVYSNTSPTTSTYSPSISNFGGGIRRISSDSYMDFILKPNTAMVSLRTANKLQLKEGALITLNHRSNIHRIKIVGVFESDNPAAFEGLIFVDIATAQEVLSRFGKLDKIDLTLSLAEENRLETWLKQVNKPELKLEPSVGKSGALMKMTEAFHTNLTAMSLLALLIGALLIYNTMTFSVLRRRQTLGILRSIGVSRLEIFKLILLEACVLGILGTAAGLLLGIFLGKGLVYLVLRTVNELYYVINVTEYFVSYFSLLKGIAIGLLLTLATASFPAWEATKTMPIAVQQRSSIERKTKSYAPYLLLLGIPFMLIGFYWVRDEDGSLFIGFFAMTCFILGFTLSIPQLLLWLIRVLFLLNPFFSNTARMVLRGISSNMSRTGMAIAALTVAVAVSIGIGIMIGSFRTTVSSWLNQTLGGDIYVSVTGRSSARTNPGLPASFIEKIKQLPGIEGVDTSRMIKVDTELGQIRLMALTLSSGTPRNLNIKEAFQDYRQLFVAGEGIFISEPMAYHHKVTLNDEIKIHTNEGDKSFRVLGIFYDYTSSQGLMSIHRPLYEQNWDDKEISVLSIYRAKDSKQSELLKAIRELAAKEKKNILVRSSDEIRAISLAMFDRTFTITQVLRLLAVLVAFMGILSALMALHLDRNREFAILRTTGMTPSRLSFMILSQSTLMGLFAGLLAIPLGLLMADLLIEVINRRSFGWSMQYVIHYLVLLDAILLSTLAALLAGIYPAYKAATCSPAHALREA